MAREEEGDDARDRHRQACVWMSATREEAPMSTTLTTTGANAGAK